MKIRPIKKTVAFLEKIINHIEETKVGLLAWLGTFAGIIIVRIFVENWISEIKNGRFLVFYDFFNSFLIVALLFIFILKIILKIEFQKSFRILIWGYLLVIFTPLYDYFIFGKKGFFMSFYIFDSFTGLIQRYFTLFGDRPDFGLTYGMRIQIFLVTIFMFVYVLIKTKKFLKSLLILLLAYSIFFFFGTFPSWIGIVVQGFSKGFLKVNDVDIGRMFLAPFNIFSNPINNLTEALITKVSLNYILILSGVLLIGLFIYQKEKFIVFLKNIRLPQILFHLGLFLVGIGLGLIFNDRQFPLKYFNLLGLIILMEAIILSWLASVVVNDLNDQKIDEISNQERPLIKGVFTEKEYKILGWFLFGFAIYISTLVNPKTTLYLMIYQIFAYFYSAWPLRLKRFTFISTITSSMALLMILFSGYTLISPDQTLTGLPARIVWLLFLGYTLSLHVKDFKDMEGDKADGVHTVPVVFGEQWGKVIVGGGIFFSFILSVILLNEFRLFWWAILGGSISFWLINKMKPTKTGFSFGDIIKNPKQILNLGITYHNIFWYILGIILVYLILLTKIIFF